MTPNDPLARAEGEAREHIVGYTLAYAGGHDELREDLDRYKAAILARAKAVVEGMTMADGVECRRWLADGTLGPGDCDCGADDYNLALEHTFNALATLERDG